AGHRRASVLACPCTWASEDACPTRKKLTRAAALGSGGTTASRAERSEGRIMPFRVVRGLALIVGCCLALGLALVASGQKPDKKARAAARDWAAHPAIVSLETTADVYALGDVH